MFGLFSSGKKIKCWECDGSGWIRDNGIFGLFASREREYECSDCDGTGWREQS